MAIERVDEYVYLIDQAIKFAMDGDLTGQKYRSIVDPLIKLKIKLHEDIKTV